MSPSARFAAVIYVLSVAAVAALAQDSALHVVPFKVSGNAILVHAAVNGTPVKLMFDSGFGGTIVLNSAIDVGPATGHMMLRDFVGEMSAKTVKLKTLSLGGVLLEPNEKLIVQQPADFSAEYGSHVDGIIGLGALKNLVVEINFQKNQFVFHPPAYDIADQTPDGKTTFLVKMLPIGGSSIELPVMTPGGQMLTMALDTGNSFYATTHKDVLERVGLWDASRTPQFTEESGVASGAVLSWERQMPAMTIFGVPVGPTEWDVIDLPSSSADADGTVGFGFLSNFNITFDYTRRRVWFKKWHTPVENQPAGGVGISAHYNKALHRTVIDLVSPNSPAALAGVQKRDEILAIDGVDLDRPSYRQLHNLLSGKIGSTVHIDISRDGDLKRMSLVRVDLVNK